MSDDLLQFAQELVRTQSYSGQEERAARLIAARMQALGYDEARIDGYGNVLGRMGDGSRAILFDSHMDTVTVTDAEQWALPPFSGAIADGYLWGRGSVDMKCGLAASLYAAARARQAGRLAGRTVYVSCTVDEEYCDGEALEHNLAGCRQRPDFAIICEPSANLIATGHKGKAQAIIRTQGVSAHGSAPEKGMNAIYEMAEIIQRVEKANRELARAGDARADLRPGDENTQRSNGTLVLSRISSTGVSLNAVPSECEIYLDRRMVVGETEATIRAEMERMIAGKRATWEIDTLRRKTWTGAELVYRPLHLAWEIGLEHELARAFEAAMTEVRGQAPERYDYWDFSTNAVATVRLGIPTIGFGPGEHKLAHMRDEKCAVGEIEEACAVYERVIGRL